MISPFWLNGFSDKKEAKSIYKELLKRRVKSKLYPPQSDNPRRQEWDIFIIDVKAYKKKFTLKERMGFNI